MEDKTMLELKAAQRTLEANVRDLLNAFERDYGVWVDSVDISHVRSMDEKKWQITNLSIEVHLP